MNKQKDWIAQMKDNKIRETLDLEKVQLSRKQKESELIADYQHHSDSLITFKQFQQESDEQICKVKEFTEYFEHLKEQFQSLSLNIAELQTHANNIKNQMDSQINQASQMQEQYNIMGSNYEQEFLQIMPLLEQQKEYINSIKKQDIQETKAFARPPPLLEKYIQLLMKTLYNVTNVEYRNLLQYLQNPSKLIREWLDFKNYEITEKQIRYIRAEFNPEDEQRIRNQSRFGYCIFNWFKTIDQVYNYFQPLRPAKAQLHLLNQNIQEINDKIQEKKLEFTAIGNQLEQLNQQLTQLNDLINQNQSQYDVQVVQRSAFQVLRKIIEKLETTARQLENEIENVDILAFVESAYNQQLKKYESKECELKIGELAIPIALNKPIEYKLNYCYSNSESSVIFVFDPYQVGRIIFEIMSHKAQSVYLSTDKEQQIAESSQIIHFIQNQQELSLAIQRVNINQNRQLFFIFERDLLEQLKQVSMDNYVNLDLNEQDLAYIYSNYSINQQYLIGLKRHNDKLKDQVNVLMNILNNHQFEKNYQLISDIKVNYNTDRLCLQQLDEQFPQFCSKLFFLLQGKTKIQFTEMANSILNNYHTKPTTPIIYCFKYAFNYSIQYMALSQTLVHPFDNGRSEQTMLGLLIHKASLNKEFELSEEEQKQFQQCYVFCSEFLNLTEFNVFELISEYIKLKNIYYEQISEVVLELDQVDTIFKCILKQRERSKVLSNLIDKNKNLNTSISKEQQEIEELKATIDFLKSKILDNSDVINSKQNQLSDLNKKLSNQERDLIYQDIHYLTHTADPDQITFELFGLLMILIDKDSTWASIQYNTNSKVKINIFNNYQIKNVSNNFLDNFNIYTNDEQKLFQIHKLNTQTQKLFQFLQTIRSKYDFYKEKIQLEDELTNCRLILKQDNIEQQKQQKCLTQQEKTLKQDQGVFQQTEQLIQLEMNVQESLNNNTWLEDHIKQIHQSKQSTLKFMNEQQVIICMYKSCEKQFKESFLRIQMKEEQQIEQNLVEFQLINSERYIDYLQNSLFAIQFQANLSLKQLDLGQQYYQNSQILKCKIIQMIDLREIDNINLDYLNLFTKESQQNLIKVNKNIKINLKKLEFFSQPLFEFSAGLAMILIQSENVEYQSALEFISKFIQQFYVNQTFSRNEFLKTMISQASTYVKVDSLGRLYIQIFILFIYVYQPGHISKLEMAQTLIQDYCKLSNLIVITPYDSLPKIIIYLDQYLENNLGEDRFRFCDL